MFKLSNTNHLDSHLLLVALAGPFALLFVGGALAYHLLERHSPSRERLDAQHVFRGYAVGRHLGHSAARNAQVLSQRLVPTSFRV